MPVLGQEEEEEELGQGWKTERRRRRSERGWGETDRKSGNKGAEREDRIGIGRLGIDKGTTGNENRLEG